MEDAQALLTTVYDAYNQRDLDAFLSWLTPDVDWPDLIEGGRLVGHDAVRDYLIRNNQTITVDSAPVAFIPLPDGRTAVDVNQIVRNLAGQIWSDSCVRHVFTLRGDKIARMDVEFPDGEH
jgi:hypothetical protein